MDFEGQYLTYDEYVELGGLQIDEMPFNLLEFEARKKIDAKTFKRLQNVDDIPQEVKICEYKLINSILSYAQSENTSKNISSESTDGYSISYVDGTQIDKVIKSKNDELDDIITTYLFGVIVNNEHIIYAGI